MHQFTIFEVWTIVSLREITPRDQNQVQVTAMPILSYMTCSGEGFYFLLQEL